MTERFSSASIIVLIFPKQLASSRSAYIQYARQLLESHVILPVLYVWDEFTVAGEKDNTNRYHNDILELTEKTGNHRLEM